MTKISELPVGRSDGGVDVIDLYEPGTFDTEPLRVALSDGRVGVPFLRPAGEGDTGLHVATSAGDILQVNKHGILVIEEWTNSTRSTAEWNWTDDDFTGFDDVNTSAAFRGRYGYMQVGFFRTISMPDWDFPLDHYPEAGDTFEYHFKIPDSNDLGDGQQYWFHVFVQECQHHTETPTGNTEWEGGYTIEAIMGSTLRIQRRNMDGSTDNWSTEYLTGVTWQPDTWYRVVVDLPSSGIEATLQEHVGGGTGDDAEWSTIGTTQVPEPLDWTSGGIGMRGSGNGHVYWDSKRLIPPGFTP